MEASLQFLVEHGYTVLFLAVFLEQIGLPIPSLPVLLAAGALTAGGSLGLGGAVAVAVVSALLADSLWYEVGRRKGGSVLRLMCRISLEPDSCVRRTEDVFARFGAKSLLLAKWVPAFNTAAPPLAGVFRMRRSRFLLFDGAGALLWSGALLGLGRLFSNRLTELFERLAGLGRWPVVAAVGLLLAYLAWKARERRRFLRRLRVDRIEPAALKARLDAGEPIVVVDLRHALDFEAEPLTLPGALRLDPGEVERRHAEIPRDRDVILFCT